MKDIILKIEGMTCGHCEKFVRSTLMQLQGVQQVDINLPSGATTIVYDEQQIDELKIRAAVNNTHIYQTI
jgi:copper chaperone